MFILNEYSKIIFFPLDFYYRVWRNDFHLILRLSYIVYCAISLYTVYGEIDKLQLERALHAMQEELAEVQSSSHTKLDKANELVDGIEEKASTVNKKLHDAEARLAEVNRKNTELDMKLRELEVRESLLQKERLSVATEYGPCFKFYEYF